MVEESLKRLKVVTGTDAREIAIRAFPGNSPALFWLGGFKSDMRGTKAEALAMHAKKTGRAYTRFDYSGHGESSGKFEEGTISRWAEEARAVFERVEGPQVVVGSSMGGWIALLLARSLAANPRAARKHQGHGADRARAGFHRNIDVASALGRGEARDRGKRFLDAALGLWRRALPLTRALFEDGKAICCSINRFGPAAPYASSKVFADPDVPYRHALKLVSCFAQDDVVLTLIKDGDHRLSRPEDLERLMAAVDELAAG